MGDVIRLRPKCEVPGCGKFAHNTNTTANPRYRKASWVREEFGVEHGHVCGHVRALGACCLCALFRLWELAEFPIRC